jgi:predicted DCC family thiol-disulfide oxidoreductase YuxK
VLVYDGGCGLCRRAAAVAVRIAGVELVDYHRPAQMRRVPGVGRAEAEESVVLVDQFGGKRHGYEAVTEVVCAGRRMAPLCWVMRSGPMRWIGPRAYRAISKRRHRLSRWVGWS